MSWTRYNHVLTPGHKTCINGVTWNGVIMTAGSRHDGGVGLLLGDGSVRFVKQTVSPADLAGPGDDRRGRDGLRRCLLTGPRSVYERPCIG